MEDIESIIVNARKQSATIIYGVINGRLPIEGAIDNMRRLTNGIKIKDESIDLAFHALGHYRTDEDIRQRDQAYAEMQKKALRAMADQLSQGLPLTKEHGYW